MKKLQKKFFLEQIKMSNLREIENLEIVTERYEK